MKKIHVKKDYAKYKDEDLIAKGKKVGNDSTNNPNTTNSDPPVTQVVQDVKDFDDANTAAMSGDHLLVLAKANEKKKAADTLDAFADWVDRHADGNRIFIESCGLECTEEQPSHHEYDELELKHGENPGEIIVRGRKIEEAASYAWQIFYGANPPDDPELWKIKSVSLQIETVLKDLQKGDICIRYCGVTKDGMQPWSPHRHIFVI